MYTLSSGLHSNCQYIYVWLYINFPVHSLFLSTFTLQSSLPLSILIHCNVLPLYVLYTHSCSLHSLCQSSHIFSAHSLCLLTLTCIPTLPVCTLRSLSLSVCSFYQCSFIYPLLMSLMCSAKLGSLVNSQCGPWKKDNMECSQAENLSNNCKAPLCNSFNCQVLIPVRVPGHYQHSTADQLPNRGMKSGALWKWMFRLIFQLPRNSSRKQYTDWVNLLQCWYSEIFYGGQS